MSVEDIITGNTRSLVNQYADLWEKIPCAVRELLWFTHDMPEFVVLEGVTVRDGKLVKYKTLEFKNHPRHPGASLSFAKLEYDGHNHYDPSTIYFPLPIQVPEDLSLVPKVKYSPAYCYLSPEQRYVYLTWLQDISGDIDVGYKFLFYYGLERRLLIGMNFDSAFEMVIHLSKTTANSSFSVYSKSVLFYTLLFKKKEEWLDKLAFFYDDDIWARLQLLLKSITGEPVLPEETIKILKSMNVNRRYLKNEPKIYAEQMAKLLSEKYGRSYISINEIAGENNLKEEEIPIYANFPCPLITGSVKSRKLIYRLFTTNCTACIANAMR